MGANSKMYQGAWLDVNPATCIDWPSYKGEASLSELAERVAAHYRIKDNDTLIGSSMGGMVALEISKLLHLDRVVLVGSAIDVSEMNLLLTLLTPFVDFAPIEFFQKFAGRHDSLFQQMFASSDAVFMRTMCKAISTWDGYPGNLTRITRIHGEKARSLNVRGIATLSNALGTLFRSPMPGNVCISLTGLFNNQYRHWITGSL